LATVQFHKEYSRYKEQIEKHLSGIITETKPVCVYQPITYVLDAGGKRVRAVLTMLSAEAVGGKRTASLHAACAIEILHNFTLVHDDVMDNSPLRRGRPTVHTKWDTNVAILSGDQLVAYAYQSLLKTKSPSIEKIMRSFTKAFIDVCEGQGFDKEFETRTNVSLSEYLHMIHKKTACVISAACEMGALAGNGTTREVSSLQTFGNSLGMAFQIQDDLLDITGTEQQLGKPIGGDVMEGKKTYLLLKALEWANNKDKKILQQVVRKSISNREMIKDVLDIYQRTGVIEDAQSRVLYYTELANKALSTLKPGNAREMLYWLSQQLLERNS